MVKRIIITVLFCVYTVTAICQEIDVYEKSNIEWELLPIKKMLITRGPVAIDSFINLIGDRHQFIGVNISGRGWFFNEYAAELKKVYTGASQKPETLVLETRIYSGNHAMILWIGNMKLTLRDGSVLELKSMMRNITLHRVAGKWVISFITESIGAPFGTWPPVIKE